MIYQRDENNNKVGVVYGVDNNGTLLATPLDVKGMFRFIDYMFNTVEHQCIKDNTYSRLLNYIETDIDGGLDGNEFEILNRLAGILLNFCDSLITELKEHRSIALIYNKMALYMKRNGANIFILMGETMDSINELLIEDECLLDKMTIENNEDIDFESISNKRLQVLKKFNKALSMIIKLIRKDKMIGYDSDNCATKLKVRLLMDMLDINMPSIRYFADFE